MVSALRRVRVAVRRLVEPVGSSPRPRTRAAGVSAARANSPRGVGPGAVGVDPHRVVQRAEEAAPWPWLSSTNRGSGFSFTAGIMDTYGGSGPDPRRFGEHAPVVRPVVGQRAGARACGEQVVRGGQVVPSGCVIERMRQVARPFRNCGSVAKSGGRARRWRSFELAAVPSGASAHSRCLLARAAPHEQHDARLRPPLRRSTAGSGAARGRAAPTCRPSAGTSVRGWEPAVSPHRGTRSCSADEHSDAQRVRRRSGVWRTPPPASPGARPPLHLGLRRSRPSANRQLRRCSSGSPFVPIRFASASLAGGRTGCSEGQRLRRHGGHVAAAARQRRVRQSKVVSSGGSSPRLANKYTLRRPCSSGGAASTPPPLDSPTSASAELRAKLGPRSFQLQVAARREQRIPHASAPAAAAPARHQRLFAASRLAYSSCFVDRTLPVVAVGG